MMILTKRFCDPPNLSQIGFCGAKSGFLRCESMVFVVQLILEKEEKSKLV